MNSTNTVKMNEIHKRNINFKNDEDDYDQESGEYKKTFNNIQINNKSQSSIVKIIIGFAVSLLIMGCYVDIFSSNKNNFNVNKNIMSNQETRKLKAHWREECERSKFDNIEKYINCFSESVHILILSDTQNDYEITQKYDFRNYDVAFMHLNELFTSTDDIIKFFNYFEEKSPWIFVEGMYIGNEKVLEEYKEHNVLDEGIENVDIKPSLNIEEINVVSSSLLNKISELDNKTQNNNQKKNEDEYLNLLKVRSYLRRHLGKKDVEKEMKHIKEMIDNSENNNEHIENNKN